MTTQQEEQTVPWFHVDYMKVTVEGIDYIPHSGIAETIAENIGDSLNRYVPRGQNSRILYPQDITSDMKVANCSSVMFDHADTIIHTFQDRTEFGFQMFDTGELETEIQNAAKILHQTAEALQVPHKAESIQLDILINTDHPAPGWPLDGEHRLTRPYQTGNGLTFEHTLTCRRDKATEAEVGEPCWDVVVNAVIQETSMPGAYDLELLIKAAYTAAALVILADVMEEPIQPPDN